MPSEKSIQTALRLRATQLGWRLFQNVVATVTMPSGHTRKVGLARGSADLIGWRPVVITPDMVGQTIAQFVSIEVKKPGGRVRPEQLNWRDVVAAAGGYAIIAYDEEDIH